MKRRYASSGHLAPSNSIQPLAHSSSTTRRHYPVALGLLVARLVVGGIFLVAAIPKVQSPGLFADAVRAYHLLPPALVLPFALVLPWFELLVAAYLLTGFMARVGAAGATVLLAMFEWALLTSLAHGDTAHSCGCFGSGATNPLLAFLAGGNTITWWDVVRDALLIALSLIVVVYGAGPLSIDALFARRSEGGSRAP